MNLKQAKRIQPGALVREAWAPGSMRWGVVLDKTYISEKHTARVLGQEKTERYDLTIFWINGYPQRAANNPRICQNWEVMVVSHII